MEIFWKAVFSTDIKIARDEINNRFSRPNSRFFSAAKNRALKKFFDFERGFTILEAKYGVIGKNN